MNYIKYMQTPDSPILQESDNITILPNGQGQKLVRQRYLANLRNLAKRRDNGTRIDLATRQWRAIAATKEEGPVYEYSSSERLRNKELEELARKYKVDVNNLVGNPDVLGTDKDKSNSKTRLSIYNGTYGVNEITPGLKKHFATIHYMNLKSVRDAGWGMTSDDGVPLIQKLNSSWTSKDKVIGNTYKPTISPVLEFPTLGVADEAEAQLLLEKLLPKSIGVDYLFRPEDQYSADVKETELPQSIFSNLVNSIAAAPRPYSIKENPNELDSGSMNTITNDLSNYWYDDIYSKSQDALIEGIKSGQISYQDYNDYQRRMFNLDQHYADNTSTINGVDKNVASLQSIYNLKFSPYMSEGMNQAVANKHYLSVNGGVDQVHLNDRKWGSQTFDTRLGRVGDFTPEQFEEANNKWRDIGYKLVENPTSGYYMLAPINWTADVTQNEILRLKGGSDAWNASTLKIIDASPDVKHKTENFSSFFENYMKENNLDASTYKLTYFNNYDLRLNRGWGGMNRSNISSLPTGMLNTLNRYLKLTNYLSSVPTKNSEDLPLWEEWLYLNKYFKLGQLKKENLVTTETVTDDRGNRVSSKEVSNDTPLGRRTVNFGYLKLGGVINYLNYIN